MGDCTQEGGGGGGGGGGWGLSGTEGAAPALYFTEVRVFFKTSACPRIVKEGCFFVPRYEVCGVKIPFRNIRGSDAE